MALCMGITALIADDRWSPQTKDYRITQLCKAVLRRASGTHGRYEYPTPKTMAVPIPTKPPVYNGMIAPRDSWMMPPPCNEMIPPGAPRLLA